MVKDWELALAAYNTGPGNVRKAIRRSGYKNSFWDIYKYLPKETRAYVPQFVAMIYTMNYLDDHNFIEEGEELLVVADTLHVKNHLHFETFAALTGTCVEDLQKLNPYSACGRSCVRKNIGAQCAGNCEGKAVPG